MTTILLIIWPLIVIIHAVIRVYLYPIYFDLTPQQKVKKRYLKFTESHIYQSSIFVLKTEDGDMRNYLNIHYRIDIQIKGIYRALFKPLDFKTELRKLNQHISDFNGVDYLKYADAKKRGKILW